MRRYLGRTNGLCLACFGPLEHGPGCRECRREGNVFGDRWIRRSLTSTEGTLEVDLRVAPGAPYDPAEIRPDQILVKLLSIPPSWTQDQAIGAIRAAVNDGRIRL